MLVSSATRQRVIEQLRSSGPHLMVLVGNRGVIPTTGVVVGIRGRGGHNRGRVTPPLDMAKNGHGQTPFFLVFLFARSRNGRTEHLAKKT